MSDQVGKVQQLLEDNCAHDSPEAWLDLVSKKTSMLRQLHSWNQPPWP